MQIKVNGEAREVSDGLSVSALVAQLGLRPDQIAVELNKEVLRRAAWETTSLKSGDRVEVVHFVGGGGTGTQ